MTAITTSHMIFNMFLGLKKQHLKSLCERYNEGRTKFDEAQEEQPDSGGVIETSFDFQTLQFPSINLSLVNSKLFEKTDLPGRAMSLAMALTNSMAELKKLLETRHAVIDEINTKVSQSGLDANEKNRFMTFLYFGRLYSHSGINSIHYCKYSDTMEAIKILNDSCIWFSKELSEELIDVSDETAKKLSFFKPRVGSIDYSDVDSGLMPDDKDFKDWREKFVKAT